MSGDPNLALLRNAGDPFEKLICQPGEGLLPVLHPYPDAPRRCLAAFDELQSISLEALTPKADPYCDIPRNPSLPQPVIDLPIPAAASCETSPPRNGDLFEFRTADTSQGSESSCTHQPSARGPRKGGATSV